MKSRLIILFFLFHSFQSISQNRFVIQHGFELVLPKLYNVKYSNSMMYFNQFGYVKTNNKISSVTALNDCDFGYFIRFKKKDHALKFSVLNFSDKAMLSENTVNIGFEDFTNGKTLYSFSNGIRLSPSYSYRFGWRGRLHYFIHAGVNLNILRFTSNQDINPVNSFINLVSKLTSNSNSNNLNIHFQREYHVPFWGSYAGIEVESNKLIYALLYEHKMNGLKFNSLPDLYRSYAQIKIQCSYIIKYKIK